MAACPLIRASRTAGGGYNDKYSHSQPGDTRIRTYNLCIVGFGNVGKAFVALLQRKQTELRNLYGVVWRITGVASRRLGWLVAQNGFLVEKLLAADFSGAQVADDIHEWVRVAAADALFEVSSLNAEDWATGDFPHTGGARGRGACHQRE